MKILVVFPCLNLAHKIGGLLEKTRSIVPDAVLLVVDDGSTDGTADAARAVEGTKVIVHEVNRGKGAALRTGYRVTVDEGLDAIVTIDGDGQHPPECIPDFVAKAEETGAHMVIGARRRSGSDMPIQRRFSNKMTTWMASRVAGCALPDSQSGYRLIRTEVLKAVPLETDGYEMETEQLIGAARRGFKIESVPIPTVYADERSNINVWRDSIRFLQLLSRLKKDDSWKS